MAIKKKLKVLHCPVVALYQPYLYVKGLREAGFKADYMAFNFKVDGWLGRDCDFDLEIDNSKGLEVEKTREVDFLIYATDHYDIFHFHGSFGLLHPGHSLWGGLDELRFLKRMDKKIVMSWWGCDLRTEEVDMRHKYSACSECDKDIKAYCRSAIKREVLKKAMRYADVHLSNGDLAASYEKIRWIDNAIDCDEWRPLERSEIPEEFRLPETENLRVYHSFGNSELRGDVKGSAQIREAVERLKAEGYKVEFIFFDKVPNRDLKYYQAQADIVVDQLRCGWHGSTAVECLSLGKPVITYIRPEVEAIVPHEHPLINANIDNIYEVLKGLVQDQERIREVGKRSREYAIRYHDYRVIAGQLVSIYRSVG